MADGAVGMDEARQRAYAVKLEDMNPGDPELFKSNAFWSYFERLRNEDPVHWCRESEFGPYWSVTRYNDIMAVDTNHGVFSSEAALGGITIRDARPDLRRPSFIAMDPPRQCASEPDLGLPPGIGRAGVKKGDPQVEGAVDQGEGLGLPEGGMPPEGGGAEPDRGNLQTGAAERTLLHGRLRKWWAARGSNPRPPGCKPGALTS